MTEPTLTELLAEIGISHSRDEHSTNDYRHALTGPDGSVLGRFDAFEAAAKLGEWREQFKSTA
jgi:hypothetical protein